MKREIDVDRLYAFLLDAFTSDYEALNAAFPPAPASKPAPAPEIPEAVYEAGLAAFSAHRGAIGITQARHTIKAAVHAYREHLRGSGDLHHGRNPASEGEGGSNEGV